MPVLRGVQGRCGGGGYRRSVAVLWQVSAAGSGVIQPAMLPSRPVGSHARTLVMPVAPAAPKKINIPVNIPKIFIA